jgi:hypothetical protein
MVIQIKSKNPNTLSVLMKNPNTDNGLMLKEITNGVCIGNCVNDFEYELTYFDKGNAYAMDDKSSIDYQAFCSPELALKLLTEYLSHILEENEKYNNTVISWLGKTNRELDTYSTTITVDNIYIDSAWNRINNGNFLLDKYFNNLKTTKIGLNLYSIEISGESIFEVVNLFALVNYFITITNSHKITMVTEALLDKYIRILSNIKEVPYFVYYLFIKKNTLSDKQILKLQSNFIKNNPDIESVVFTKNDTHEDRMCFVKDNIDLKNTILDFGCGELRHFKKLKKVLNTDYYAYDLEDYSSIAKKYSDDYKKKIIFTQDKESLPKNIDLSVILSEVIEHNEEDVWLDIINDLLSNYQSKQIIITTPNKDFNIFYNLEEEEVRLEDHVKEYKYSDFIDIVNRNLPQYTTSFSKIGDTIVKDGIEYFPTIGLVITRK